MPHVSSAGSASAESRPRTFGVNMQRLQAGVTIPRALGYLALVGLAVLFLWLTLRVDLVIFGGVLFAISLRRTAEVLSRVTRLPVGWSLLDVGPAFLDDRARRPNGAWAVASGSTIAGGSRLPRRHNDLRPIYRQHCLGNS